MHIKYTMEPKLPTYSTLSLPTLFILHLNFFLNTTLFGLSEALLLLHLCEAHWDSVFDTYFYT